MACVAGYEFDVFISYTHLDNTPRTMEKMGWVDTFKTDLQWRLRRLLGDKELKIWKDNALFGNEDFSDAIQDALKKSAVFICVMSPTYLTSHWCGKELNKFIQVANLEDKLRLGNKYRIFKVEQLDVPREDQPEILQRATAYKFFDADPPPDMLSEFWPGDPSDKRYFIQMEQLARELASFLKEMRASAESVNLPLEEPVNVQLPHADTCIYLAPVTPDLEDEWRNLRSELVNRGVNVVPQSPLPNKAEELKAVVAEGMQQASRSIHMFGEYFDRVIGDDRSMSQIQFEMAADVAPQGADRFERLVWIPQGIETNMLKNDQRNLVEAIEHQPDGQLATDVLRTGFEEFKDAVLDKIPQPKPAQARTYSPTVYFTAKQDDLKSDDAHKISEFLRAKDYELIEAPAGEEEDEKQRKREEANIGYSDAVMIFCGTNGIDWVQSKALQARDLTKRRRERPLAAAVYNGPPAEKEEDLGIHLRDVDVVDGRNGFEPKNLEDFCKRIEQGG